MTEYREEDFLNLSGIQHFAFCRRQWALIHIEQQWAENLRTVEGNIMHERAHDGDLTEKRGDVLITRALPVFSRSLGVNGICDVVEFHQTPNGVRLTGWDGRYQPVPVEYKKGKPKEHQADELQICAQAMCLEDMLLCEIPFGYLYYGEPRRRTKVDFTPELRETVRKMAAEMHQHYARGYTPKSKPGKHCKACSLADLCLPKLCQNRSAKEYINRHLTEGEI